MKDEIDEMISFHNISFQKILHELGSLQVDANNFLINFDLDLTDRTSLKNKIEQICSQFINDIQTKITQKKQKHCEKIKSFYEESEKKLNEYTYSSNNRLMELEIEHQKNLDRIKNEKFVEIGISPSFLSYFTKVKNEIYNLKSFFPIKNNQKNSKLNDIYKEVHDNIKRYESDLVAFQKYSESFQYKFQEIDQKLTVELAAILNKQQQFDFIKEKEINEKQKELATLIEKQNQELIDKAQMIKNRNNSFNLDLNNMKELFINEIHEISIKMKNEKNVIDAKIQQLCKEIEQNSIDFKKLFHQFEEEFQNLKEKHFVEKVNCLSSNEEEMNTLIKLFSEKTQSIRLEIQSISNDNDVAIRQNREILMSLKNSINQIRSAQNSWRKTFNELENKDIETLNNLHDQRKKDIELELSNDDELFLYKINNIIDKSESDFVNLKASILSTIENERYSTFKQIEQECSNKYEEEVKQLLTGFTADYEDQSKLLNSIEPPSSTDIFKQFTNEINDLAIKRTETNRKIVIHRKSLLLDWEKLENEEIERHQSYLKDINQNGRRGRDTIRQNLRMQISNTQKSKENEIYKLKQTLNEINNLHSIELQSYSTKLINEKNNNDIQLYENELENTRNDCRNRAFTKELETNQEILSIKNRNEEESSKYINEIFSQKENYKKLIVNYENDLMKLNQCLTNIFEQNAIDADLILEEYNNLIEKMKSNHIKNILNINETISQEGASIARSSIENRKEIEYVNDENTKKLNDFNDLCMKEKEELFIKSVALNDFLTEKLNICNEESEKAKTRYETRPSRESDLAKIKLFEGHCSTLMKLLKKSLVDMANYKNIMIAKEKEYNSKFGRNPSVGVLRFSSHKV